MSLSWPLKDSLHPRSRKRIPENYCDRHGIAVHRTVTPYGEDTLTKVKASELDVLVLVDGFGIVKKGLIQCGSSWGHFLPPRKYASVPRDATCNVGVI